MKLNKYFLAVATILLVVLSINTASAQPPPPPPPTGPPCWPPPCIPVDNGMLFAVGAAVLFGVAALWKSMKARVAR